MDIVRKILNTVIEEIKVKCDDIGDDDDLLEVGLDSISFIRMILELEKSLNIFVDDEDLLIENFNTISKINIYIENYD